jgi:hypothetical protein
MKPTLMMFALLLTGCIVPDAEEPIPCTPCRFRCDQDFGDSCRRCREENCPNMAGALGERKARDRC